MSGPASKGQVVVTRPAEDSERLAADIRSRGYAVLIEPMLEIVPLDAAIPPLDPYAALAFTSANGVRAFTVRSPRRDLPVFAVGGRTAAALAGAGFRDVRDAGRDAAALARLIAQALPPATRILHLSGEAVAQDLAALLADSGIAVDRAPLYRAEPAAALSDGLVRALGACTVSYVVLFSVRTASSFGNLIERFGLTETMRATTALCLSQTIAAEAGRLGWTSIIVAAQPTSAALLDCLPPRDADDRRH